MLTLTVVLSEQFDDSTNEFLQETVDLELEHSLVSLSKWESKHKKAFLGKSERSGEETLDYVRCMILTPVFPANTFDRLSRQNLDTINAYVSDPMTATHIAEPPNQRPNREIITSELIYYWMIAMNIPHEYETWHLSRLLTLIRLCSARNAPPKKSKPGDLARRNREMNEARRRQMGTRG